MENLFTDFEKPLTEDELKSFESKYNINMPLKIKKHYLMYNGGYPERTVFYSPEEDREYIVNYFYSIGSGEGMKLEDTLAVLNDENVFPSWLVPLADDEGGDIFAYSIRQEDEGAIYYYSHEFEYGENTEDSITFLASDIDTFIESLKYKDDEDEDDDM